MPVTAFRTLWAFLEQLTRFSEPQAATLRFDASWEGPGPHFARAHQRPLEVRRMLRQRSRLPHRRGKISGER